MIRSHSGERVVRVLLERRGRVLGVFLFALLLACLAAGRAVYQFGRLPLDNSLEIWFLEDDPALVQYREYQDAWGNDEAIVIGLRDPEGFLRPEALERIAHLSERLAALDYVEKVTSLATIRSVHSDAEGSLRIEPYYQVPVRSEEIAGIAARIRDDPLYGDHLLSAAGTTTLIRVELSTSKEWDRLRKTILGRVRGVLEEETQGSREWFWGGIGVIHVALNALVMSDSARFMLLTNLVLILAIGLTFRRLLAVVACLLSVASATVLLIGAYLGAGLSLNMVTMVLPTLVMVVGLTDSVYFLVTYQLVRVREPKLSVREAVIRSLGFCFWPGLFNSITTAVGFLAFLAAPMHVVRHLGVFAGLGVGCAFLSSLAVCALLIERFPEGFAPPASRVEGGPDLLGRALTRIAEFVLARRRLCLAFSLGLCALAVGGIVRLRVDSYSLAYFQEDHEIRRHDAALLEDMGPYLPLELVVRKPEGIGPGIKRGDVLRGIAGLSSQVLVEEAGKVSRATSLAAVTRRMTRVFSDDPAAEIPVDPAALEQILTFYDPRNVDDPIWLVDDSWRATRFQFQIKNEGARAGRELLDRIHARAPGHLPADVELVSGGYMPLYAKLVEHLVTSQLRSIAITTCVVLLLIALLFRSVRYALVSFLPNVLPVALTLGAMGYLGINLDMATVMVAAISLGVAVDDTIHFLYKFRAAYDATGELESSVRETLTSTGRAIVSTSLIVTLGFSVLGLASIKTVSIFGLLLCATMITALLSELFVTPALLLAFPPPRREPESPPLEGVADPGPEPPSPTPAS